ncbi:unnamed protein product [Notodromas monacha]|uniref:SET domain-containing protein n=1 Tax=Notodromas monacha TaxID=399045 RepID=A0A7R9BY03_9CRUS|nr:unnamed protein product [Notodromas monacha]CAG0923880.1 unnamed protein product [Notodromas monacha]
MERNDKVGFDVRSTPNKGVGVFATRHFAPGDLIINDSCLISSRGCEKGSTEERGQWEKRLKFHLKSSVDNLSSAEDRQNYLCLRDRCEFKYSDEAVELGILQEYGLPLGQNSEHFGFFPNACMVNHSCRPSGNHVFNPETGNEEIRAVTQILPGDEITVCYINNACFAKTTSERRNEIGERFGFTCRCCACESSDPGSERRRAEIAGLLRDIPRMRPETALFAFQAVMQVLDEEGFVVAKGPLAEQALQIALENFKYDEALTWAEFALKQFIIAFGEASEPAMKLKNVIKELGCH